MSKYLSPGLTLAFFIALISFYRCNNSGSIPDSNVFKFNLQKGKSYDFEIISDLDREIMQQKDKFGLATDFVMTVTGDDGKIKSLTGEYKDFKMKMNMMGEEINIDGTKKTEQTDNINELNDPTKTLYKAFTHIIGKKFYMKVDEEGTIQEVTGFEELVSGIISAMKLTGEQRMMVEASLKDQFNPEKIKELFTPIFSIYPGKEIKLGDTWERKYELKSLAAAKYTTLYSVKSFDGDNVLLDVKTRIDPIGDTSSANSPGDSQIYGTESGLITIKLKSGLVVDAELNQNLETSGDYKMIMTRKTKMKGREVN